MNKRYLIFAVCVFCMLPLLTACYMDEVDGRSVHGDVHVSAVIGCRDISLTRASEYVDASPDNELINDWWLVMVDQSDGRIARIVEREPYKDYPVERESFEFTIPLGTYDVYAFANIEKSTVEALSGVGSLSEGGTMPDLSAVVCNISDVISNGTLENSVLIPMTGKKTVTYSAYDSYETQIEVLRMVAKLKFIFSNSGSKSIELKYIKFNPLNRGNVLLMPDYTTLTYDAETDPILLGTGVEVDNDLSVSLGPTNIPANKDDAHSVCFYVRESLAESAVTDHFQITVGVQREGRSEEILYALSGVDFTGINRNDYVVIPIRFTNYTVDIKPHFYPPIGGYPAEFTTKDDEFYSTFKTPGDFQIVPMVYDIFNDSYLDASRYTVTFNTPAMTGDMSIFDVKPYFDPITGELIGTLGTNTGTACVHINVSVETGSGLFQEYYRRIYIIRANP